MVTNFNWSNPEIIDRLNPLVVEVLEREYWRMYGILMDKAWTPMRYLEYEGKRFDKETHTATKEYSKFIHDSLKPFIEDVNKQHSTFIELVSSERNYPDGKWILNGIPDIYFYPKCSK